jgi:hypothetical protein
MFRQFGFAPAVVSGWLLAATAACNGSPEFGGLNIDRDVPIVEECNPGLQDCGQHEKCTPQARSESHCCVDSTRCVTWRGSKRQGEECTRTKDNDDCTAGLFCMTETSGQTGAGVCLRLCDPQDPATCPSGLCVPYDDGFLPLCQDTCDPLAPSCEPGFGCYAVLAFGEFVCTKSGTRGDGEQCTTVAQCVPGLLCLDGARQVGCEHDSCCTPVCDLHDDGSECGGAEACRSPWPANHAPMQHLTVGACLSPTG